MILLSDRIYFTERSKGCKTCKETYKFRSQHEFVNCSVFTTKSLCTMENKSIRIITRDKIKQIRVHFVFISDTNLLRK